MTTQQQQELHDDGADPVLAATEARLKALAQEQAAAQLQSQLQSDDPIVVEARRRLKSAVDDELLDYKHNAAQQIEACATTLVKIFSNVIDNPGEDKYRRVKATSNVFKNSISNVKGGEHIVMLAGWRSEVVDMVKWWVFDGVPGSHKWQIMQEGLRLLERGMGLIHEKAERKRLEAEGKKAAEKTRLAAVMAALEDDKAQRALRNEMQAVGRAAATTVATAQPPRTDPDPLADAAAAAAEQRLEQPAAGEAQQQQA